VTRRFILYFAAGAIAWGHDPQAIVRESVANCERDWRESANWAWTQTDVATSDDKHEVTVSEVIPIGGTPYERLISKDGHALSPEEQRKEKRKFEKILNQRENESASERQMRIRKYDSERVFMNDIPNAYNFDLLGEETIGGRPVWVIQMKPRAGFVPRAAHGALLEHFEGKLWIDKEDVQWVKAEAHAIDTVSIGWIVARMGPGAHFDFEQQRIADGLWMPKRLTIEGLLHVMMVYSKGLNEEITYSGYHPDKELRAGTR
jgi:hypothetical protein